ncbi:MAG: DUF1800 family protein [Bacteroidota bacterium]
MSTSTISPSVATTVSGLTPYAGPWGKEQVAHLLRRTLFGPKKAEIAQAISAGMAATLDLLLAPAVAPAPPVNFWYTEDPNVPIGAPWVEHPHVDEADVGQYRWPSLRGWYFQSMMHSPTNIMEKMAMFWFNHFGMADVGEHRAQYQYIQLFREEGIDNYRTMIEKITVHPAMLRFLNGDQNNKWQPNENYARELLELFTIQKGPQVAPEDYTHYTEHDIRVAAKILTGWRNQGFWSSEDIGVYSEFVPNRHWNSDPDDPNFPPKTLSHRFDNVTIANNGADEYKDLIAVIFGKRETARAFCRELYRYFVYYKINDQVENDVIEPLADVLIDNDFAIAPTLRALFGSEHFYDVAVRGPLIKSPYDFMFSMLRPMGAYGHMGLELTHSENEADLYAKYDLGSSLHWWATTMDMDFLYPPSVAGWKAYYQVPTFYRNWIGSTTLQRRRELVRRLVDWGFYSREERDGQSMPRHFDYFAFVEALDAPIDPNELVAECAEIFLPRPLHPDQLAGLKENLLGDLPDDEWTTQYLDYLESPNNPMVSGPIEDRLKSFFYALFSMAEFHLM